MVRDVDIHPRWVMRREERRAGRYSGDKVVRWIARPTLIKGRATDAGGPESANGAVAMPDRTRQNGFQGLRVVSDN